MKTSIIATASTLSLLCGSEMVQAFTTSRQITSTLTTPSTQLNFGIPTFGAKDDDSKDKETAETQMEEKKIGMAGLVQLVTAGMVSLFV